MGITNRKFSSNKYRYGFNGKEKDNEASGDGNAYDFGARIQDPRLGGRFFSTDPMAKITPGESPYTFAGNNPVALTDFNGLFKISPYFVKKYPTLAKILKYIMPTYINNVGLRNKWISKMGFETDKEGVSKAGNKAWEEMFTYGEGPWVDPNMHHSEIKSSGMDYRVLLGSIFIDNNGMSEWSHFFPDNIHVVGADRLEAAVKSGNSDDIAFNVLRLMILCMHEGSHRWGKQGVDYYNEDGALAEEAIFGMRFTYTKPGLADFNAQRPNDDKIRKFSKGISSVLKAFSNTSIKKALKKMKTPEGQKGDPVVILSGNEKVTGPQNSKDNNHTY
jgi:RHS repeat-associated protein